VDLLLRKEEGYRNGKVMRGRGKQGEGRARGKAGKGEGR